MQVTQQVYVIEEWVWNAHNKFKVESLSRREVEKALGTLNEEKMQLARKLKVSEHERLNAVVGLKTAKAQTEDQHKLLYTTKLNLAIEKAMVLSLKAELQKAKEATKVARKAAKAAEEMAYERGVEETETRLAEEVTVVYRDYYAKTYCEALDQAGVPTDSKLWRAQNVYFPEDIREDPTAPLPPATLPHPLPKQPPIIQDLSLGAEVPTGAAKEKGGVVGNSQPEDKGKDKGVQPPTKANPSKDYLTIKDVVSKVKGAEPKSKVDTKKDSH